MKTENKPDINQLFNRIVFILEEARSNVVRAVNINMIVAYWLIGREIVQELQQGEERAEYGKRTIESLSKQLTERFGSGFSEQSLQNFRRFYQIYPERFPIPSPAGRESLQSPISSPAGRELAVTEKDHPMGDELSDSEKTRQLGLESDISSKLDPTGRELQNFLKSYPSGSELASGFSPQLSWSHYRALMRVKKDEAREFYEREAMECGWSKAQLERQIHSSYYERIIANRGKSGLIASARDRLQGERFSPESILKSPYVLEFLGLPDSAELHESHLEQAIITYLQNFLLELGKGFAFVARQKRLIFEDKDLYVDLVFYNCVLKFYLLIDLKMGELSHQDVGQMDGYVRMFDDLYTADDDNPTIGLILCTEKNEAVARYSVLDDHHQIFASKYMLYLPTEKELQIELERERKFIEEKLAETK